MHRLCIKMLDLAGLAVIMTTSSLQQYRAIYGAGYPVGVVAARFGAFDGNLRSWGSAIRTWAMDIDGAAPPLQRNRYRGARREWSNWFSRAWPQPVPRKACRGRFRSLRHSIRPKAAMELAAHAQRLDTSAMSDLLDRSLRQLCVIANGMTSASPFAAIVERQSRRRLHRRGARPVVGRCGLPSGGL